MVIETEMVALCGGDSASVTTTWHVNFPFAVGLPVIAPVDAPRVSPGASCPE